MTVTQLRTPILSDGIQSIHFFNGRLLSAEDLSQEQAANLQARSLLGKAIGDGVAYGLEVHETAGTSTGTNPVITVGAGLALNRDGIPLQLKSPVEIELVRRQENGTSSVTSLFADCQPLQAGPYVTGKGVYLLTIQAASGKEGRAPVSGLGNLDAGCNAKYSTDGVQFRLIQVAITPTELNDVNVLRNHLAYRCFGGQDAAVTSFSINPFGPVVEQYGLLDGLREQRCLLDNEVPLALIYWSLRGGIEFVDMWSVRRRVTRRSADADWLPLVSDRRAAEGEARFFQYQDHITDIRVNQINLENIIATQQFRRLPAAGLLPISDTRSSRGFRYQQFFRDQTCNIPVFIQSAQLESLLHESFHYPSIDLRSRELIWLYFVRENQEAIDGSTTNPPQKYLVFASGHMPYRGNATLDVNGVQYSNYGLGPA